jgi:O-antigen/teichoic acid export membrane protein
LKGEVITGSAWTRIIQSGLTSAVHVAVSIIVRLKRQILGVGLAYGTSALSYLTTLLVARILGVDGYIWIVLGQSIGPFLSIIISLGTQQTFVNNIVSANTLERDCLLHRFVHTRILLACLVSIIVFPGSIIYTGSWNEGLAMAFSILWVSFLGLTPNALFDYGKNVYIHNISFFLERAGALLLIVFLFVLPAPHGFIVLVPFILFATRVLSSGVQFYKGWKLIPDLEFSWKFLKERKAWMPSGSIYISIALLCNAMLIYGNQIILEFAGKRQELSAYGLCFQTFMLVTILQSQILRLMIRPIADDCAHDRLPDVWKLLHRMGIMAGVAICLIGPLWILIRYILPLLTGFDLSMMYKLFPLLSAWAVVVGPCMVVGQYLFSLKEEKIFMNVSILSFLLSLGLGIILVPAGGIVSLVVILLLLTTGYTLLLLYCVLRKIKMF